MNLLIKSDLPESPEVLLLAGILSRRSDLQWIPSPEVIVCKLIKVWAWVAAHGYQDSDSSDYRIPSPVLGSLESQFCCVGLIEAMSDRRVDWCRMDYDHVVFCRFAEWNGEDAIKRRGDSARARRSRQRSLHRMARTESETTTVLRAENDSETSVKAHANCDARHASRALSTDVDVDVDDSFVIKKETSTYSSDDAIHAVFVRIRSEVKSHHGADERQVAKDRETAWKVAALVCEHLNEQWIDRVLASIKSKNPRRPYAYLSSSIEKKLSEIGVNCHREMALLSVPIGLADPADVVPILEVSHAARPIRENRNAKAWRIVNEGQRLRVSDEKIREVLAANGLSWP